MKPSGFCNIGVTPDKEAAMSGSDAKPPINVDYFEDLTGKIEPQETGAGGGASCELIGRRIARLREQKGISIEQLSHLTGFDRQMLEGIEQGAVCPQLGTIIKLSKALDSALERLLGEGGHRLYAVTRRGEHKVIARTTTSRGQRPAYTYMSLAPEVKGRHMEPLMVELKEMSDQEMSVHAGEEFIHVLDGTVILRVGDEQFELEPGDSAYYLSTTRHLLSAKDGTARILAVIYGD
jgi:transcriptional regulator with XRE-family HTH domain